MQQFSPQPEHRMTDEEAQAVLAILAERQRQREELRAQPSVRDVAMISNAPVGEVESALAEVRARFAPIAPAQARPFLSPTAVACVAAAFAFVFMLLLLAGTWSTSRVVIPPPQSVAPQPAPDFPSEVPPSSNVAPGSR